ncbi:MAG: MMPL family transporter [Thiobacillaceae bacterium]
MTPHPNSARLGWNARITVLALRLFGYRRSLLALFTLITLMFGVSATHLRVDASFNKLIPLQHEYMRVFSDYKKSFGGANRVLVALMQKDGDIYQPAFFKSLRGLTDDVFFLPGVDRATVTSLFTPNVRFTEIIEEGFAGGNVIPAGFQGSPAELETVRRNVLKSGQVGRLVANDFKGALVTAELLEFDPASGARLDYQKVAQQLEQLRAKYQNAQHRVHIIGFAKAVGDITDGARGVLVFFGIAFVITAVLLMLYFRSFKLALLALACALVPVIWLLGLLPVLGYGIDPLSILVPFLIFSIGASHAVQMTNVWKHETLHGADGISASRNAFTKLFIPGATALLANAIGFLVILHIDIAMVQEMAVTASLGVALMIVTNKILLPILLSYQTFSAAQTARLQKASNHAVWKSLSRIASRKGSLLPLAGALVLLVLGAYKAAELKTGDLGNGIPELHATSRYNTDAAAIVQHFSIGVDVLAVIAQTHNVPDACTRFEIMDSIDRFEWEMKNIAGVQSVRSLPGAAKLINAGWNENSLKWRVLSRNSQVLAQSITPIDTSSGLLNTDCSAMQIMMFTTDHKGETIARIVSAVKAFNARHGSDALQFKLASGNVGVMAATNEAVDAAEITMLIWLFAAISALVLWEFRSLTAWLCIVLPLALVSLLCNALMAMLGIGLKVSTLPVIALGVGVGVDYGIYLYERMQHHFSQRGATLADAFYHALCERGTAAVFTAITMSIGVGSWAFSALKFQADMGLLLAFMFLVNMLGAILLLPALAAWTFKRPPTLKL